MKHCRKCEVPLVVGENWSAGMAKRNNKMCRDCDNAAQAAYRKANPRRQVEWRNANPEKDKATQTAYRKANLGKFAAQQAKRRALTKAQTPSWYCHATVTEIYEVASEFGYEVDHIVPLSKGGLHSHENLQLLTPAENRDKWDNDCWIDWK